MENRVPAAIIEMGVWASINYVLPCHRAPLRDIAVSRFAPEAEHVAAQIVAVNVPDVEADTEPLLTCTVRRNSFEVVKNFALCAVHMFQKRVFVLGLEHHRRVAGGGFILSAVPPGFKRTGQRKVVFNQRVKLLRLVGQTDSVVPRLPLINEV